MKYKKKLIEYYKLQDNAYLINNINDILQFVLLIDDFRYKNISQIINKYNHKYSTRLICFVITLLFNSKLLNIIILNNLCVYY